MTEDIERFLSYVEVLPSGCWFWNGARSRGRGNKKWYGSFRLGAPHRKVVRAHRFSDEVIAGRGPLPKGWHRDHKCEFSLCVNPDCIERVTHAENERRKQERRAIRRTTLGTYYGPRSLATERDGGSGRPDEGRLQVLHAAGPGHEGVSGTHPEG